MVLAYSTCLGVRFPSELQLNWWARISRLFSGVLSSWDMLERNSDLYRDVSINCSAFSSSDSLVSSTSRFLRSTSVFCSASSLALCSSSSLVCRSSSCWSCNSWVSNCDCLSNSSVRMFASMVLSTMPIDSASWSRNTWWMGL
ncbi:hypothetical protein D3C84_450250 [compost metagenome]